MSRNKNQSKKNDTTTTVASSKQDEAVKVSEVKQVDKTTEAVPKAVADTTKTVTKAKIDDNKAVVKTSKSTSTASKTTTQSSSRRPTRNKKRNTPQPPEKVTEAAAQQSSEKKSADSVNQAKPAANAKLTSTENTAMNKDMQDKPIDKSQVATAHDGGGKTPSSPRRSEVVDKPQKRGGLGVGLALLLGVAGTGLGAYSFNEIRALKAQQSDTSVLAPKIDGLNKDITNVANETITALKEQADNLSKQQKAVENVETTLNKRISAVEQMQKGLTKSVKSDIDQALDAKMGAVDALLNKVNDIELGQKGLAKNINQVSAGSEAINPVNMSKQEIGYLLRMAHYKLQSERDVVGATGLLKMAEDKLLAANKGKTDELVDSVREKLIQLSGVKPVDADALVAQLKTVSQRITDLQMKVPELTVNDEADSDEPESSDVFSKLGHVIASGVKYTPKDPSKIDISAETILIEKRLMQADVKTAEFAIQSQNKVILAESIQSIKKSLEHYFADDETARAIDDTLTTVSQSQLKTVLPDLSGLVKQFDNYQIQ